MPEIAEAAKAHIATPDSALVQARARLNAEVDELDIAVHALEDALASVLLVVPDGGVPGEPQDIPQRSVVVADLHGQSDRLSRLTAHLHAIRACLEV